MSFTEKLFGYIKKNTLVFRTLLLFFIAGSLMMFLVSGFIMGIIKDRFIKEIEEKSRYFVEQSYNTVEISLEPLYNRLFRMYNADDVIIKAMYAEGFSGLDYEVIYKRLREEQYNNNLISSIYIYNAIQDNFIYYFDGASGIIGRNEMFDKEVVKMIENTEVKPVFILRKAVFADNYGSTFINENWISLFFGMNRGTSTPAFIVNINQDLFRQMTESPIFNESQKMLIIDYGGGDNYLSILS